MATWIVGNFYAIENLSESRYPLQREPRFSCVIGWVLGVRVVSFELDILAAALMTDPSG